MTAAERYAIKVLMDRAMRSALAGQVVHAARLYGASSTQPSPGSTLHATPMRITHDTSSVHDEALDDAQAYMDGVGLADIGANYRGYGSGLPSQRRKARRAA